MDIELAKKIMLGLILVLAFFIFLIITMNKKSKGKNTQFVQQMSEQKSGLFNMEIIYQKFYIRASRIPLLRRYVFKLRRRLEVINIEDEYLTRKQTSQILIKSIAIIIPLTIVIILLSRGNLVLRFSLLLFEAFFIESLIEGYVDKIDNKLLRQQIDFFAEIRHAYHEFNMVEEAIYDVSQNDELEVSRQAEKIYEVLISDDPETELEKYYDVAPNSYLKEFAGVSYLTKEFGDRKDKDGASLYLKNLNNITQEMQIEILKRDKLDYVFQSLSLIAAAPVLALDLIKGWAISQFGFTTAFYNGVGGFFVQIAILILTLICYMMVRNLKDNGSTPVVKNTENPWQAKLYAKKPIKKIVDYFIPKDGTKEYRKVVQLLKDAASKLKIEWFYINKLATTGVAFLITLLVFMYAHHLTVYYIYNNPTTDYNLMGSFTDEQIQDAMAITEIHNYFLDLFKDQRDVTIEEIKEEMIDSEYYSSTSEEDLEKEALVIFDKLQQIQNSYLKWYELLVAFAVAAVGYYGPNMLLYFQYKMRQMEMENEVMQFQTIILMLMKIERVNVEMILEWLERYSNIFREPISRCVNNYESGPWEALEELKNSVSFKQLIRIVESLQAAVEQIPIREAFDELDTERAYHQEKRKESNERLIKNKSLIGKVIGFAPMVVLFCGYLIVPLVLIGMQAMTSTFAEMTSMTY
ncbi:MAG: hypothetical protein J6J60_04835 [Clostridia bacterium]|nr:hypothetical protein [Clostridia bacterium]